MNDALAALKSISFNSVTPERLIIALLTLAVCLMVMRILLRIVNRAIIRLPIEQSLHGFVRSLSKILFYFLTVIIVADTLGVPVTSLLAVLGVAGLAVSLAAQNALSNVAGGLMLLSSKPFMVGDYIETAGISGTVFSIGMAYTKIKTVDNKIVCVPNSTIAGNTITNFTAEKLRRVDVDISIAHNSDPVLVKQTLLAVINAVPGVLPAPAPYVNAQSYEENCVTYTLRAWTNTPDYFPVRDALLEQIQPACTAADVKLAYPQMAVRLTQEKAQGL